MAWEVTHGPIPAGFEIDHEVCDNPACYEPTHLVAKSKRENIRRSQAATGINHQKTHCDHGHEFTPENTYQWNGHRGCRKCRDRLRKEYRQRQRG